jgi:hypothetical protein
LDFSSLARLPVVRIACVWLTSITIRNVGSVVATFFGYGGRMGIGIRPGGKRRSGQWQVTPHPQQLPPILATSTFIVSHRR